ncbi:MAG: 50S ribosomal protein L9 [Candidatus Abyssobacteria bacterium SURF_5]|uniref:Large ribosomal subunit protein bL9 n=1 Tax=Abyssobacteria bacterium (strain SURF_5) TaxID=2093360 RepID=A0A3A4NSM8_ABYX5|nr:MAG: 50S ribosomal protein L9 [Candidatus Abyssubacteria bacterium SURF_5]
MKVILREDVQQLGKAGDVVEVKDGYARNYLIARSLAVRADTGQMKHLEHERKLLKDKKEKTLKQARDLADKISKTSCTIAVQVGEEDKMYGSVTSMDIAKSLVKEGIEIDKKDIHLDEPIRSLGVFTVPIRLASEVEAKLKIWIVKE